LQVASLQAELNVFEQKYMSEIGSLYAEMDEITAQFAEQRAVESPEDDRLMEAAHEAREKANRTYAAIPTEPARKNFSPTVELKRLYREIARRVHPDLTLDHQDRTRREILMADANKAYQNGDESALQQVLASYERAPEAVKGDGAGAELVRTIRRISQIRERLDELNVEAAKLIQSDLQKLRVRVTDAARNGKNLFLELSARLEQQISKVKTEIGQGVARARNHRKDLDMKASV
jgi:ABC-type phosphate transport system auxiliary subunit